MSMDRLAFISELEAVIRQRHQQPGTGSYTASLFAAGTARIAQKVGEEGVELALASVGGDRKAITSEAADLVYHLLVLLEGHDIPLAEVVAELSRRHRR
jgi:phosphoribosyl-AMP cyclohydrolase / phosphoribosyl-ATP pyrophosphohydrolase